MRTRLFSSLAFVLALALPGCLGGGAALEGPRTVGDQGRTSWQIYDGLCGGGLFGSECDLGQHLATGGSPLVQVRGRNGTSLAGATLMGVGATINGFGTSSDDHGTLLQAHVSSAVAGVADVVVLDAAGHEIDRAHLTFVSVARLTCGELRSSVTRDLTFAGLTSGVPVTITRDAMATGGTTTLACRADDASGNALLSVDAIRWGVAAGAVGSLEVRSDDLLGSVPAFGATARVVTVGEGSGTIHAMAGAVSADVAVTFH